MEESAIANDSLSVVTNVHFANLLVIRFKIRAQYYFNFVYFQYSSNYEYKKDIFF